MKATQAISAALLQASFVLGHGGVTEYQINGEWYTGMKPYNSPTNQQPSIQRYWQSFDPIQDPTSVNIICNNPGTVAPLSAEVPAGSEVVEYWNSGWAHNLGPMVTWMTECPSECSSWNGQGGKWFKIDEAGLSSGVLANGKWGSADMIAQNYSWTSTIPRSLKPGNYLLRTETIALHSNPPQWYPNCAQLKVTGSGTVSPGAQYRASIPGVYSMSDPSINIQDFWTSKETTYKIPGPDVWKG
ncbi:glycoside hydrolase family 61 protein [Eremomyces bilateralis CBS 781.70]|uniref:AA9 family lytic polysaccharide monooxygenase n=1 Tax=Eremomyces bilateralis CBS 781.70 TaxID=1392243 RepID=A0A6G1GFZ2_9PEZI|nr:glycoside hydrolase family 61 protein [Eremomyces bilateralis CBS 781.70]KAF1816944.1 glycoside hydrolase family 61 protein [Eremomyces bilateralis CBS 781.70]